MGGLDLDGVDAGGLGSVGGVGRTEMLQVLHDLRVVGA
jgi:hypothetical protein